VRSCKFTLEHARAAFIDSHTLAADLKAFEQILHALDSLYFGIQLLDFSVRDFFPTLRDRGRLAKAEKQFPNLVQIETRLLGAPNDREPV
jgi:hypothetical protein